MVCPVCEHEDGRTKEWCPECGSYLGLLAKRPRHVGACIRASIMVGAGLFLALAWQIFIPLAEGSSVGQPSRWFWLVFALATFFLTLGLTARQHLGNLIRRLPQREIRPAPELRSVTPPDPRRR